ncbi:hypothetical protein MY1884_007686 [Beauveria asiatica]
MMNRLPRELVQEIVLVFAHTAAKNHVLTTRLVCRDFNHLLRPIGCRTLNLDSTRLNKHSKHSKPRPEGLQTIGHRCKALHIDMTVLRDDYEVETLSTLLQNLPSMDAFCRALRHKYSFSETAFTEHDFYQATAEMLFYCRDVDRARICLPFPVMGVQCSAATRVLANALKALAQRPDEDSTALAALVVDGVADDTLCELWMNPSDVMNMQALLPSVETLVLVVRRLGAGSFSATVFGVAMWNMIWHAARLKSLCLAGSNMVRSEDGTLQPTTLDNMDRAQWLEKRFPGPGAQLILPKPAYLELKNIMILPEDLLRIAAAFGPSLEELHMTNVCLMTQQSLTENTHSDMHLWVGLPNQDPGERLWMAMRFRALMPKLRICRCSYLNYKVLTGAGLPHCHDFDYSDPSGLGRSVSQRFVEVVTGVRQPRLPSGEPAYMRPHDPEHNDLLHNLADRRSRLPMAEHDYNAHRLAGADRRPDYQYSIDGLFRNCVDSSIKELTYIAEMVREGVTVLQEQTRNGVHGVDTLAPDLLAPDPPATG